ncbi:hypothetical protein OIDMADRAFT_34103 [Oidiodendron maius Zn]|uniref:Uncharacterized protein n=1 Tax=Oidiodendron maius (strain Zn) TaxID=913774 RepID=A0A0C3C8U9_OIDMZ|nr:hypothetical protein OIDMADRAFT_34103 [Oidiodendron maius Zn]
METEILSRNLATIAKNMLLMPDTIISQNTGSKNRPGTDRPVLGGYCTLNRRMIGHKRKPSVSWLEITKPRNSPVTLYSRVGKYLYRLGEEWEVESADFRGVGEAEDS